MAWQTKDPLCGPLRDFVRSVGPSEVRDISFHTMWGGNFKDTSEPAIFAKRCFHHSYDPAKPVCTFLMEHGATEFSDNNVKRVAACLSRTRFAPQFSLHEATFSFSHGSDDRGAHVTVAYGEDSKLGGMAMHLSVSGY